MPQIHLFNPGHETAILQGSKNYTPPANVRRMQKELELLPLWYAEAADFVLVEDTKHTDLLDCLPYHPQSFPTPVTKAELAQAPQTYPLMQAAPWGMSPQSLHLFEQLREDTAANISVAKWKTAYYQLAGRQTAAKCMDRIQVLFPDLILPETPLFCTDTNEIEHFMATRKAPFVLKTPYSSSGRGLLWINEQTIDAKDRNWINGAIAKQGAISIERGLDKAQDFALEFYSDGQGHIRYEGLSVFDTEKRGAYSGNLLLQQDAMRQLITRHTGETVFEQVRKIVTDVLAEVFGTVYTGYLGVDMLVYKGANESYAIHPCVEVNMRYTMGMVALRIFQKHISLKAKGYFHICYEKEQGAAQEAHQRMMEEHPLRLEAGKIAGGYLPLCPVGKETHYRAYALII